MVKNVAALSISKLDAARRQLEVAIRLFFFDDDPVSIYTLAAAAYSILNDVASAKDIPLLTAQQWILDRVVQGKKGELVAALRRHQNFFKHADRDADATIDFNPGSTEWLLFDCTMAYAQLTTETTPLMGTFNYWWQFSNHDLIKSEHSELRVKLEEQAEWFSNGRRAYFAKVLPLFQCPNTN